MVNMNKSVSIITYSEKIRFNITQQQYQIKSNKAIKFFH